MQGGKMQQRWVADPFNRVRAVAGRGSTSVRRRRERRRAVLRRSTLRVGSLGEGGRRSPASQPGVLGRRYGCGPGRGSGVRHMGGLDPGFICPGTHLLGDTAGAAGPLGPCFCPAVIAPSNPSTLSCQQ